MINLELTFTYKVRLRFILSHMIVTAQLFEKDSHFFHKFANLATEFNHEFLAYFRTLFGAIHINILTSITQSYNIKIRAGKCVNFDLVQNWVILVLYILHIFCKWCQFLQNFCYFYQDCVKSVNQNGKNLES